VLWRTCWGTYWEPGRNSLRTWIEHSGNTLGTREFFNKFSSTPPP
jgi:hypothetical protein